MVERLHPAIRPAGISVESAKSKEFLRLNVGGHRFMLKKETILARKVGQIHQPSHLCPIDILDELDYWGIVPDNYLAPCCCAEDKNDLDSISSFSSEESPNQFKHLRFGELRRKVWNVIEEPTSSGYAQVFATFSVLFVLISISGLVLGSLPELQVSVQKNTTQGTILYIH
ncbi:K+ channel tetramerization domain protein [Cooperia oncophora]